MTKQYRSGVVILSGGLDSTVLLHLLKKQGVELVALSFNYGQRHVKELDFAFEQAVRVLDVEWHTLDLRPMRELFAGSALTSGEVEVPDGHYADESMKATVVPNRNMVMISLAGALAISRKLDFVAYAAHPGDHAIYPDCRPEFTDPLALALHNADWHHVQLLRPFVAKGMDKAAIVRLGAELGVGFTQTWSCYRGQEKHCGTCGTCTERKEAFELAGVEDPTDYEA